MKPLEGLVVPLEGYLHRQREWSERTFGPGRRTVGLCRHIAKELTEIQQRPDDLDEWIDVLILAMDGFWRHGGQPHELFTRLREKQAVNMRREWPAWLPEDQATEHLK